MARACLHACIFRLLTDGCAYDNTVPCCWQMPSLPPSLAAGRPAPSTVVAAGATQACPRLAWWA